MTQEEYNRSNDGEEALVILVVCFTARNVRNRIFLTCEASIVLLFICMQYDTLCCRRMHGQVVLVLSSQHMTENPSFGCTKTTPQTTKKTLGVNAVLLLEQQWFVVLVSFYVYEYASSSAAAAIQ